MKKRWSETDDMFLKQNYSNMTAKQIGSIINRTIISIHHRIMALNLQKINRNPKIEIDKKYGQLTILKKSHVDKFGKTYYFAKCECGNNTILSVTNINKGTKSCGCLKLLNNQLWKDKEFKDDYSYYGKILNSYKNNAKSRKIDYNLEDTIFFELIKQRCHYCNKEPKNYNPYLSKKGNKLFPNVLDLTIEKSWIKINGIDRKYNKIGYNKENCVPCCTFCNSAKSNMDYDEFIEWIRNVYNITRTERLP